MTRWTVNQITKDAFYELQSDRDFIYLITKLKDMLKQHDVRTITDEHIMLILMAAADSDLESAKNALRNHAFLYCALIGLSDSLRENKIYTSDPDLNISLHGISAKKLHYDRPTLIFFAERQSTKEVFSMDCFISIPRHSQFGNKIQYKEILDLPLRAEIHNITQHCWSYTKEITLQSLTTNSLNEWFDDLINTYKWFNKVRHQ